MKIHRKGNNFEVQGENREQKIGAFWPKRGADAAEGPRGPGAQRPPKASGGPERPPEAPKPPPNKKTICSKTPPPKRLQTCLQQSLERLLTRYHRTSTKPHAHYPGTVAGLAECH